MPDPPLTKSSGEQGLNCDFGQIIPFLVQETKVPEPEFQHCNEEMELGVQTKLSAQQLLLSNS